MGSFPRGKWQGHEYHRSPSSSAEVKNEWSSCTSAPLMCLDDKEQGSLYLYLYQIQAGNLPLLCPDYNI